MPRFLGAACFATWILACGAAPAVAGAMPLVTVTLDHPYEHVAAEKGASKVETTKAWLGKKKSQTNRWIGRQKQKLKQLAD